MEKFTLLCPNDSLKDPDFIKIFEMGCVTYEILYSISLFLFHI